VFGSQVLDTAIGLAMMLFVIATTASMIAEIISRVMNKRASDLERAIGGMLGQKGDTDPDFQAALSLFKETSVYQAASTAGGKHLFSRAVQAPSYLSAKAFADAIVELLVDEKAGALTKLDDLPRNLRKRIQPLVKEAGDDLVAFKAGLERWFDDTMDRAEGAYKRWTTLLLFCIGLVIAVAGNASTVDVAQKLYVSSVTREAVVQAADSVVVDRARTTEDLTTLAGATDTLAALHLPVGWDANSDDFLVHLKTWSWDRGDFGTLFGWLLTALLVMLGAPFWFDLLNKLVALRTSGTKPPTAENDQSSATRLNLAATGAAQETGTRTPEPDKPKTRADIETRLGEMLGATVPVAGSQHVS
jgi:hypothetical protein